MKLLTTQVCMGRTRRLPLIQHSNRASVVDPVVLTIYEHLMKPQVLPDGIATKTVPYELDGCGFDRYHVCVTKKEEHLLLILI